MGEVRTHGADIDPTALSAQCRRRHPGLFQGSPGQGQQQTLLRVHLRRLVATQPEALVVEVAGSVDKTTDLVGRHMPATFRSLGEMIVSNRPDALAAVFEQAPERKAVVGPGETAGKASDSHRLSVICKP